MTTPTFSVHTRFDKKSNTQVLLLEGEFGLKYIDRIKSRIDSINFDSSKIVIELKDINSIDLSTVQLVYSLKKTLCDKGKTVNIVSEIPEDIIPIIRNAGFYDFLKS
jgi:ABC-type transporter Mla MlaB component